MYSTAVLKIDSASKIRANWLKFSPNSAIFGRNSANFRQFTHTNFNLFHYAGNNPVKYVDPDGREDGDNSNQYEKDCNRAQFLYLKETLKKMGYSPTDSDVIKQINWAIENHKYDPYTKDFRCDNFVETVLDEGGFKTKDYLAGSAAKNTVQQHIDNAVNNKKTEETPKTTDPKLSDGAYVVFMNNSTKKFMPHAGFLIVEGSTITFTDNSSSNNTGGVKSTTFDSETDFQSEYGYSSFYYQKIVF